MKNSRNIMGRALWTGVLALQLTVAAAQGGSKKADVKNDEAIRPYKVAISNADLKDLRERVLATKWPSKETVADQSQGVQLSKLQDLVQYWGTNYDWRKAEAKLNAYPQFITKIDGVDIHFIHVRSKE